MTPDPYAEPSAPLPADELARLLTTDADELTTDELWQLAAEGDRLLRPHVTLDDYEREQVMGDGVSWAIEQVEGPSSNRRAHGQR